MRCPVCGGGGYATLHRDVGIKSSGGKKKKSRWKSVYKLVRLKSNLCQVGLQWCEFTEIKF